MNEPKPKRTRRQYDEEFRRNTAALVASSGRPLNQIAAELGVSHWNLRDWTKGGERKKAAPPATAEEMQREMTRLRHTRMKALQEQGYRIGDLCAAFGVSRSGYHRARTAASSLQSMTGCPSHLRRRWRGTRRNRCGEGRGEG